MNNEILWSFAGCIGGAVGFFWGFAVWRRLRIIQDTPTSKVRSMPMGRVELFGRAQEKAELVAPITRSPCVYYQYTVEEERRTGRDRRKTWVTVDRGDSSSWGFYLEDETGHVLVMPAGAKVEIERDFEGYHGGLSDSLFNRDDGFDPGPWASRTWWGGNKRLRFREWRIAAGDPVYCLGVAQERPGIGGEQRQRILDKLRALKSDPEAMAHFDTDGDGHISDAEWEVARQLVTREEIHAAVDDRVVVGADPTKNALFYLSDRDESAVLDRHRWQVWLGIYGGAALSVTCLWFLLHKTGVVG